MPLTFITRDHTGYEVVASFETEAAANTYLRKVERDNTADPDTAVRVERFHPRSGEPRAFSSCSAHLRMA